MNKTKNWNCDNDKCAQPNGELRVLPIGGSSNALLCRACFNHEIQFRKERNKELSNANAFKLPLWENLITYNND